MVGLTAASCGNAKKDNDAALNDKKQELVKLKEDEKKISKQIADLEAEIAKLDTNAAKKSQCKTGYHCTTFHAKICSLYRITG